MPDCQYDYRFGNYIRRLKYKYENDTLKISPKIPNNFPRNFEIHLVQTRKDSCSGDSAIMGMDSPHPALTEKSEIQIYPNPTACIIYFSNPLTNTTLTLTNSVGTTILSQPINSNTLNISHLPNGIYHLGIQSPTHFQTAKIIKE